jgi:hypothetical protein
VRPKDGRLLSLHGVLYAPGAMDGPDIPVAAPVASDAEIAVPAAAYVRFIIVCDARTGSNMLVQALNSHPRIVCFREIFNWQLPAVDYAADGFGTSATEDVALRQGDPARFLRTRVFAAHDPATAAVGFKFPYPHFWGYPGMRERLAADAALRIIHLQRRNAFRSLVSRKIALATERWAEDPQFDLRRRLTPSRLGAAARDPFGAVARTWRRRRARSAAHERKHGLAITPEECDEHFYRLSREVSGYDETFAAHEKITVWYEDLVESRDDVLETAQRFLGVEPQSLTITLRRQNPEPLRELVANYDALRARFAGTPHAMYFDE